MHGTWQSVGHVLEVSPHCGWQTALPQLQIAVQSPGQVVLVSPQLASQVPLPQTHGAVQSAGHVVVVSPHAASHFLSPQNVDGLQAQSVGQVNGSSPHWGWHCELPQRHGAGQSAPHVDGDSPH